MKDQVFGQCLCGAVSFSVAGALDALYLCHCSRCRKDSGSAHSANLFAGDATLCWSAGEDRVRVFRLAGTRHVKSFCAECGSALPYATGDGGAVVVPAGSLDSPVALRPRAHICHASRAAWDDDLASVPRIDGLPG
ncbi:aldehyde-activating protein [Sulfitobacter alexandrii]|uniref:Aldehyde-activating protein n=1 Tax=Sulfitobacter alexandrii TaxID=1917485 RepID=A0A1J0WJK4_9RHOB|nr:GFA family protein [Sulfitobacter alexandrii]APE44505.1 aldehyde-activating protein [Sulfitobacter alexandrii]